jgi:hypothetical protein
LHKSNATTVKEENERVIEYIYRKLMCLAVAEPNRGLDGIEVTMGEVRDLIDELLDASFRSIAADVLINFPEDCEDELDTGD